MDLVHDIIAEEEEDRISNLPDDIIHRVLSFLDMKYAIQTSALSKKWKHIWTSIPHLNFDSSMFRTLPQFAKFVKHVLSHRNHHSEVSAVELKCTGAATQFAVKSIVNYAYLHNVQHLNMTWCTKKVIEFPQYLFSCHTLKHLTLATSRERYFSRRYNSNSRCCIPKTPLDFPVLETMSLNLLQFGDSGDKRLDLFSKCVNLKDLTLHNCSIYGVDIFDVCAPQLCNLIVRYTKAYPKVFNVVAPQLENLTLSGGSWGSCSVQLSIEGLDSLEKVNLSMPWYGHIDGNVRYVPKLLDLFQKLRSAKFLILDMDIIKGLSSSPDALVREPCPFSNLKYLKINKQKHLIATVPTHVRNYFLESSPSATLIMDLPQVAWKRSKEEVDKDTMARKVAKLEEEKQKQDEVIAQQKAMLKAMKLQHEKMKLQHEKLIPQIIDWKMTELKVQVAGGNPDYELIRIMGRAIKSIMESTPESLRVAVEAQFSRRYEEAKRLFLTRIDARQWAKIETELGCTSHSERINSLNTHIQADVHIAALPPLPSRSSTNISTSSTQAFSDQD